ncbi:MerR family transcriptional regulator [Arthrobacter rhombi]|uniref:MerR family transcriptional regulator n=1 Tax=Arthrobacter rhombi TaxID=71253 RepID=UPI003FD152ED
MMTIGEFALHTGIGVKALRFYDERGILPPAHVDPGTGYRFYAAGQLRTATTIRALRTAGMSLEAVAQALDEPDRATGLLAGHQDRLRAERLVEDRAVRIATRLLAETSETPPVQTRQAGPTHWAAVATTVRGEADDTGSAEQANHGLQLLGAALTQAGNPPTGGGWTAMAPTVSTEETEVLLGWPVGGPVPKDFEVEGVELRTGTLPDRTEAFMRVNLDELEEDLLDDIPNGRLLRPGYLAFVEFLERNGHEPRHMRQTSVLDDQSEPMAIELSATVVS